MHKKEEKGNIFARLHSLRAHKWLPLVVDRSFKSASSLCTASPPSLLHYSQRLYLIISPSLVNATEMLKSFSGIKKNRTNVLTVCMLLINKKRGIYGNLVKINHPFLLFMNVEGFLFVGVDEIVIFWGMAKKTIDSTPSNKIQNLPSTFI